MEAELSLYVSVHILSEAMRMRQLRLMATLEHYLI